MLVHGGPGGYDDFVSSIRRIFSITTELDMHLAFDCADPVSGEGPQPGLSGMTQIWPPSPGGRLPILPLRLCM